MLVVTVGRDEELFGFRPDEKEHVAVLWRSLGIKNRVEFCVRAPVRGPYRTGASQTQNVDTTALACAHRVPSPSEGCDGQARALLRDPRCVGKPSDPQAFGDSGSGVCSVDAGDPHDGDLVHRLVRL